MWKKLSGKKTAIAALYWSIVMPILPILYPDGVPTDIQKVVTILGIVLTSLGLGHKAIKSGIATK